MPQLVQNLSHRLKHAWRQLFGEEFDACPEPIDCDGLRGVCHVAWPQDAGFIAAWEQLFAAVPAATTFHSPIWQKGVVDVLSKAGRLRLLAVWQGARMVGVLPMHLRNDGLLESLAPAVSDYLDPLIHPEHEQGAWRIVLKLLARLRAGKWRDISLHNIRDNATCRTLLPDLARAEGFDIEARITENCPCLTLPKTWDDYLASLDAHERKEVRRKINKVLTKGSGRLVRCAQDPTEIASTLTAAFALMEQAPGEKGEAVKKTLRPLLEKAAPALIAQNRFWLTTLYINNETAACTLQFPHPTGPQFYNCGFDNSKKEWSPGVVLTAQTIQQAIESGAAVFDLLRGPEPYKYRLGAVDRPLWMLNLKKL